MTIICYIDKIWLYNEKWQKKIYNNLRNNLVLLENYNEDFWKMKLELIDILLRNAYFIGVSEFFISLVMLI